MVQETEEHPLPNVATLEVPTENLMDALSRHKVSIIAKEPRLVRGAVHDGEQELRTVFNRHIGDKVISNSLITDIMDDSIPALRYIMDEDISYADRAVNGSVRSDVGTVVGAPAPLPISTKRKRDAEVHFDYPATAPIPDSTMVEAPRSGVQSTPFTNTIEPDYACLIEQGYHLLTSNDAPNTRADMLSSADRDLWLEAEEKEIRSIELRRVIEGAVDIPKGIKPIPVRWVYKVKDNITLEQTNKVTRATGSFAKARIVAKGFAQVCGLGVTDLFAPTGKNVVFRLLLVIMLCYGLVCAHIDVNTAFLYADLATPIYLEAFPGYALPHGQCLKAVKAIYGLRNSPKAWFDTVSVFIKSQGFMQSVLDPCLYYQHANNSIILILIYVDDILVFAKDNSTLDQVFTMFNSRFDCKNLGVIKRFLGMDVIITTHTVTLSQMSYAEKIVEKFLSWFSPLYSTPRKLPLPYDTQERLYDESQPKRGDDWFEWWSLFPYMQIIGALLYLAINTRPDLMFTVCMLARYSAKKSLQACFMITHVLSYLSGTLNYHIKYNLSHLGDQLNFAMLGFSDSDWAGHLMSRRSTAGYLIKMLGAALAWSSKLMATMAASSMEAEYMAAFHCAQEIVFLRNLMKEIGVVLVGPTPMLMDAKAAIDAINSSKFHARTKHIAVKWRIINKWCNHMDPERPITTYQVPTEKMSADLLTKHSMNPAWENLADDLVERI